MNSVKSLVLLCIGICIPMVFCDFGLYDKFDHKKKVDFGFKGFDGKNKDGNKGKKFVHDGAKYENDIKYHGTDKGNYDHDGKKNVAYSDGKDYFNDGNKYDNDGKKHSNRGNKYDGNKRRHGGKKYVPKGPKFECRYDKDCRHKEVCSGGFCNPRCPPCHEWDFTIWKCRNMCTRKAKCYKNTCICPKCRPMSGYDAFWDCSPPKFLRSICHERKKPDGYNVDPYHKDSHRGKKDDGYNFGYDANELHRGKKNIKHKGKCQGNDCYV